MKSKYPFKPILKYIPSRYDNLKNWQIGNQKLVYDFKNGIISDEHRQRFLDVVKSIIDDAPAEWIVCFVPASTKERTEQRYAGLATFLQDNLPCPVYLHSIQNYEDYEPVHQKGVTAFRLHSFHREHFIGKHVVLIDDVITTGRSFIVQTNGRQADIHRCSLSTRSMFRHDHTSASTYEIPPPLYI